MTTTRTTGTPTWLEYGAAGLQESIDFYAQVFGWTFEDMGPDMAGYRMASAAGHRQAGFMDTAAMTCPDGGVIDPSWDVYLAVDDLDERLERARTGGARIVIEPTDIPGQGRFAGIIDPAGAYVGLWQDQGFAGYTFSARPGTPVWFELMSMDYGVSTAFYAEVFDFEVTPMEDEGEEDRGMADGGMTDGGMEGGPDADMRYATNAPQERASAGICEAGAWFPDGTASFWRVYFAVEDADATITRITDLGGKLLDGPMDSPFGRVATVADPAGATFQINQPPRG